MKLEAIAHVRTCYGEKFGVPRQSGIVDEAWGELIFTPEFRDPDALRGLEDFSHLWLVFLFHQAIRTDWKPTVRPPRLGGNKRVGVFASRSPFRPNPIGLSVVRLESIDTTHPEGPMIKLRGVDLVDGTPIIDIKPYIPYADALPEAAAGFAPHAPEKLSVHWINNADQGLSDTSRAVIEATIAIDPRPAYQDDASRTYGCLIDGYNIQWKVRDKQIHILSCQG
ncbi:tRNA (N6-threonylcarbamoyladenosine(37)-N6)-methyltransferase TrmO [Verrucomicrobiaceae bacterium N1E253]|uniref:tRNA (N6-threonylcarbamoyladenosine(37)-N6)-methyltransferase TrmO n=1 Tax=Oceaniferula marina TaxID=2748318 RepID=A0A851GKY1_9BACT|nr:tRNA (N6-threonylcarbamoyladenosine(37)-N6)-methyltransferase TrmO [Oceaniferula marina]NWK55380.1 tRNA (N6-threonylcarbamoyladenosine(37)-N6)-methyltransferase TrmO [Oceaniferula marina]